MMQQIHRRKQELIGSIGDADELSRRVTPYEPNTIDEAALVEIIKDDRKIINHYLRAMGKLATELSAMRDRVHQANMRARKKVLDKGLIRLQLENQNLKTEIRRLKGEIPALEELPR